MTTDNSQRSGGKRSPLKWVLPAIAFGAALAVLFLFDPATHRFYPACLFHKLTGLWCPGCGSTRALHQLIHGNLSAAFRLNPLAVGALPVLGGMLVLQLVRHTRGRPTPKMGANPVLAWGTVALVVAFWVLRNAPLVPFCDLAP